MMRVRATVVAIAVSAAVVLSTLPTAAQPACRPTPADALGPFYTPNAPERAITCKGLVVTGAVRSGASCGPVARARIEWWSANPRGEYDDAHSATEAAGADGRYRYETDFPGTYPGRPPHLHVKVTAPGHRPLVTQIYPRPGQSAMEVDLVLTRE